MNKLVGVSSVSSRAIKIVAAAAILLLIFFVGVWAGRHQDFINPSKLHVGKTLSSSFDSPAPGSSVTPSAEQSPKLGLTLAVASPAAAFTPATSAVSVADRLLKEANAARESGDIFTALARLEDASQRDPKNAEVLAEMAMIYESIQNFDQSAKTWRRVQEIGPSAGPLYELADMKLKTGVPAAPGSATGSALDAGKPATALDASRSVRSTAEGIPAGSTLGITEVTASETPDPDAETRLMLRIGVKKSPNAVIDPTQVIIQVLFYDTVGDNDIRLTDATVSYEWLTPTPDWAYTNSETMAVTYFRPKTKVGSPKSDLAATTGRAVNPAKKRKAAKRSSTPEASQRKYLGYIVRLYYNGQLQDERFSTRHPNLRAPESWLSLFSVDR
jgi:hypothetical protein